MKCLCRLKFQLTLAITDEKSQNEIKPYVMNVEYIERDEDHNNSNDYNRKQDILLMLKVKDFEEIKQKTPFIYRWNGDCDDKFFSLGYNTFVNRQLKGYNIYDDACCKECEGYTKCYVNRVYMIKHIKPYYEIK